MRAKTRGQEKQVEARSPARDYPAYRPVTRNNGWGIFSHDHIQNKTSEKPRKRRVGVIDVVASFLLLAGAVGIYLSFQQNKLVDQQITAVAEAANADVGAPNSSDDSPVPSADEPSDESILDYQVAPDEPRFITIDSLDVFARVRHLGIDRFGNVGAPTNIHDTGWFEQSSLPKEEHGSSVIVGHIGRDSYKGVFYDIGSLFSGRRITVTNGDGTEIHYEVTKVDALPVERIDMSEYLRYDPEAPAQLHLITCTGVYDVKSRAYNERLIVSAVRVN